MTSLGHLADIDSNITATLLSLSNLSHLFCIVVSGTLTKVSWFLLLILVTFSFIVYLPCRQLSQLLLVNDT